MPISRDYFRLRRLIDRRLYELARKHCGRQASWRIRADLLQKKCGSKQEAKHFAAHLRGLVRSNHLPDYAVTIEDGQVVFSRRPGEMPMAVNSATAQPADGADPGASTGKQVRLTSMAIDQAREIAPRWDLYALENLYITWASDKDTASNEDARFLGWVKSYTKGKSAP